MSAKEDLKGRVGALVRRWTEVDGVSVKQVREDVLRCHMRDVRASYMAGEDTSDLRRYRNWVSSNVDDLMAEAGVLPWTEQKIRFTKEAQSGIDADWYAHVSGGGRGPRLVVLFRQNDGWNGYDHDLGWGATGRWGSTRARCVDAVLRAVDRLGEGLAAAVDAWEQELEEKG